MSTKLSAAVLPELPTFAELLSTTHCGIGSYALGFTADQMREYALAAIAAAATPQPAKTTTQQLKDIYAFLASTAPEGIADEAFRNIPNSILPDSWRTEQLSLYAVKGDADGERLGLAQQDRRAGGRIDESLTQPVQPAISKQTIEKLHTFLDASAGDGVISGGVDAADLYIEIFPERYAEGA